MLNTIIRHSLQNRPLVLVVAVLAMAYGAWETSRLPIDVFPDLNRPRVTIVTEAHGMAPEEVESLITFPLESVLNGAAGVESVRSSSGVGISVVWVEFGWDTRISDDRQIVTEKLALVAPHLPEGVQPQLAPISSIMGQILVMGLWSKDGSTSPMELRTFADWTIRPRLLAIPGVAQVFAMGGERKQMQVLVDPAMLLEYGVTLDEVERALSDSNSNVTGGYLDDQGPRELLVRSLGRVRTVEDLQKLVVKVEEDQPILLEQVARVIEGPAVKRGDSSAHVAGNGEVTGGHAVALTINKQPGADTRQLSESIAKAVEELRGALPSDVHIEGSLYEQKRFIDLAISNVVEALTDGSILVVIVLFVFLLNLRTTAITLVAIPLSLLVTAICFTWFGLGINTMTLGGLAVAIGELVDDSIVDVENIFRRLRENHRRDSPLSPLLIVYRASSEVRSSIVIGTLIVVLVYLPLFALGGMEGRLFVPLGVAYVVSILASLLVSLTLTPVLAFWLLPRSRAIRRRHEGIAIPVLRRLAGAAIGLSLTIPKTILMLATSVALLGGVVMWKLERDFLPPFNEGYVQINLILPPGTSLARSNQIAIAGVQRIFAVEDVVSVVRRTGRAELDEHAEGVNMSEIIVELARDTSRSRADVLDDLRNAVNDLPGVTVSVEQPLAHLISHMLSGVKAQIGIKLYGDDLGRLRHLADQMLHRIEDVEGVRDLFVEPQITIPQLRIELDRDQLALHGLTPGRVNRFVQTAMNGRVLPPIVDGMRTFDLLVRLEEPAREDLETLKRLSIELPGGGTAPLDSVARIYLAGGPNTVSREQVKRRIVLQCNVAGRGVVDVVRDIQQRLGPIEQSLPTDYFVEYGGQFESQRRAAAVISALSVVSLAGVFLVLYAHFRSANLALQVMVALPMAFVGGVTALVLTGQTLTIASLVGFISVGGIAARNGVLLLSHYLHLMRDEAEPWSRKLIVRSGQERIAPVLMTALTSGIALVPLALAAGEPGKEILYPVATVMIGGLMASTLLEFFVRPALFWTLGRRAAEEQLRAREDDVLSE